MAGAFILLPSFASTSQSLLHDHFEDRAFQAVHEAGDLRDSKLIVSYFGRDDDLNVEVLSVLGSLQSQETIDTIIPFLRSSNVRVRLAAAWALAQTARIAPPRRFIDSVFTSCIESERSASAKQGFIALAGFCCGADAVIPLRRAVFGPDIVGLGTDTSMSAAWATAIARMAVHGIRTRVGIDDAAEIIRRAPFASMAARTAAQALARAGDSITLRQHTALLLEFAGNPEPDLRASMIEALGKLQIDTAGSAIVKAAVDTASIVRIAALRLLPTLRIATEAGRRYLLLALIRGITSRAYCIAKTALQSIARLSHSDMRLTLAVKRLMDTTRSIDLRNEALRTLAAQAPDLATAVIQNHQRAENPSPAALEAVGILGSTERRPMPEFRAWLTDNMLSPDANRASAAAAAVGVLWNIAVKNRQGSDAHDDSTYRAPFLRALTVHAELRHGGTVQTILEALLDPLHPTRTATAEMLNALQHFSSSDNVETVVALIDAVAHTGDSTAATALGAYLSDPHPAVRAAAARALHVAVPGQPHPIRSGPHHDWDLISAIARHPYAIMHTSRGNIRVRLFVVDAPFTIEAFARLAQEGFYNGLTFHRVVPNFVVQGGDPSGDGSGGPPFTLRSEFSMRTFRYGRLGLASAGKDTEGSQFFFMLADALHLDGRYTCLGDVVSGADVMDNLEIGDTINSIEVERASDGQLEGHHR